MTVGKWADALSCLGGDGPVYVAGCCGEPTSFLDALDEDPELARGRVFTGVWIPGVNNRDPTAGGGRRHALATFATPALSGAIADRRASLQPMHYSTTFDWLEQHAGLSGAVFQVSAPRDGHVSLGVAADFTPAAVAAKAPLIGQVNPAMPFAADGPTLPVERFDRLIEAETALPEFDAGELSDAYLAIGANVADLIREGDTVQFGLGKLQDAVAKALSGRRGLTLHGGMISPASLTRLEDGCFEAATIGVAIGDARFYDKFASERRVSFRPVSHTHSAAVLISIQRLVSVNSILEVDLFGQGNGEFVRGRQVTGHGGLLDFVRGAGASPGGRSILALPATYAGGSESRIVPDLDADAPVTVPRSDVDWVVTEHGAARLRHATIDERAERLVAIAAPAFRDALWNAWEKARARMTG
ncbi:MAG: acetyl-CoA hydrolase/transferase C-terminal domain-containing protein [Paracoccaceae bacterium]|nr:acetyl-CoA hydrolase/transferase C-terminal domain-containing protein [Paracoccaceae bacterium]